jgi:hypothetical protein
MNDKVNQQVREAIADHYAAHPYWRQEKRDREMKEAQEAEARAHRAVQARQQEQQQAAANNTQAWCSWVDQRIAAALEAHAFNETQSDVLGRVIAEERRARCREVETAIAEVKHWVEGRLGALEGRIAQQIGQYAGRADSLGGAIEKERVDRRGEIDSAIEEVRHMLEEKTDAKLTAFEERITQQIAQYSGRADSLGDAIAAECADRRKEIGAALTEIRHALETRVEASTTALEAHMKALLPAKLPIAKAYCADSVHYAGQVVVHRGSTYQAVHDTARAPPQADDWVCLASAGRDAVTPTIRGTYNTNETYKMLDVVAMDGASFIACKDNPGLCPNSGDWQLLCRQGNPGRRGAAGERGPKGDRGEAGIVPQLVNSKIDENYNLVLLRSDETLEILPLRAAFERYHWEASGYWEASE